MIKRLRQSQSSPDSHPAAEPTAGSLSEEHLSEDIALQLDELSREFIADRNRGHGCSIEEFAGRYPDLVMDLTHFLRTILDLEDLKPDRPQTLFSPAFSETDLPRQLGDFRISKEIGRGGMGIVFEAEQLSLNRLVALKILPRRFLCPAEIERFQREAELAAALHHSNIVPIFACGEIDGYHYFAMQKISGKSLSDVLKTPELLTQLQSPSSTSKWIANIGVQVAEALHYAHQCQTLHRDIKPGNLLLDVNGRAWISDFGVACRFDHKVTVTMGRSGTTRYQAPERFTGKCDARSEVYSLGVTLLELAIWQQGARHSDGVTPRPPAPLGTSRSVVSDYQRMKNEHRRPLLPADLEAVLLKSIQTDPALRYQSAEEMAEDLDRYLSGYVVRAGRARWTYRLRQWRKRNPSLATSLAAIVVLMCATTGVLLTSHVQISRLNQQLTQSNAHLTTNNNNLIRALFALDAFVQCAAGINLGISDQEPSSQSGSTESRRGTYLSTSPHMKDLLGRIVSRDLRQDFEKNQEPHRVLLAVSAPQKVGHIMYSLGHMAQAEMAAKQSLDLIHQVQQRPDMPQNVLLLWKAQLMNDLASIEEDRLHFHAADEYHEQALRELDQIVDMPDYRHHAYEWGRAHFGLGVGIRHRLEPIRFLRDAFQLGNIPQDEKDVAQDLVAEAHLVNAMDFLRTEQIRNDRHVSAPLLIGKCLIERARNRKTSAIERQRDFKMGIYVIEQILLREEQSPRYRHELAQGLASSPLFGWDEDAPDPGSAREDWERAYQLAEQVASGNPNSREFTATLAKINYQLAVLFSLQSDHERAHQYFQSALELQESLIRQFPNSIRLRMGKVIYLKALEIHWARQGNHNEAKKQQRTITDELDRVPEKQKENRFVRQIFLLASATDGAVFPP